jgi:hypothetical protein
LYDGLGLLAAIRATAAPGIANSMIEPRWFDVEAPIYGGALTPKRGRISVLRDRASKLTPIPMSSRLTEGNESHDGSLRNPSGDESTPRRCPRRPLELPI